MKFFFFVMLISFIGLSGFALQIKSNNNIVIKGQIKKIPAKKVYLTDAYRWKDFLDSASYKNDTFSFHIKRNTDPFLVSICFINQGKIQQLTYRNYVLSNNNKKYGSTGFMLDKGTIIIKGSVDSIMHNATNNLEITPTKQNDVYFRMDRMNFGFINAKDNAGRDKIINEYKEVIKKYPYSYYLIQSLYGFRLQYSKDELFELLSLFDMDIQNSNYVKKLSIYFKEMPKAGIPLHNLLLKDSLNNYEKILDDSSKLNMLIFWASWCVPCMHEIPLLKEIYSQYKNKGLHMVSISLDKNEKNWKTALNREKMNWDQLIVSDDLIGKDGKIFNQFGFMSIPTIIITDKKGIEIIRVSGFDDEKGNEYKALISKYLKMNNN